MWKNRFAFEVIGRDGYARITGLGGSYGVESLTIGRRGAEGSVPEETVMTFTEPDPSWDADWSDFVASIENNRPPEVDALAGLTVMNMVADVYAHAAQTSQIAGLVSSR
jgi:predicted dehydrogenase